VWPDDHGLVRAGEVGHLVWVRPMALRCRQGFAGRGGESGMNGRLHRPDYANRAGLSVRGDRSYMETQFPARTGLAG
jgi:hypothetical protein